MAEKSEAGYGYMKDMAKATALRHFAEQFKVKVGKMVKQYRLKPWLKKRSKPA